MSACLREDASIWGKRGSVRVCEREKEIKSNIRVIITITISNTKTIIETYVLTEHVIFIKMPSPS